MATAAERLGGERQGDTQSLRQVALASFIGTTIEWYDFFLYGTAAALIFGDLFFPNVDPTSARSPPSRPSASASPRARSAASSSATSATASGASRCS